MTVPSEDQHEYVDPNPLTRLSRTLAPGLDLGSAQNALIWSLIGTSAAWTFLLIVFPVLAGLRIAFAVTLLLILADMAAAVYALAARGKLVIELAAAQLPLFCLINYQLFRAFGEGHYAFEATPRALDWVWLSCVHFAKAADLVDVIDAYSLNLIQLRHESLAASLLLVLMHLAVDFFLIAAFVRWLVKRFRSQADPNAAREFGSRLRIWGLTALAINVVLVVAVAATQGWRPVDWLAWPLDNALRTIDVGDLFQIFHWRLHGVEMGFWTVTLAVAFRVLVGIRTAEWINALTPVPKTLEQYVEEVSSKNTILRQRAARAVGSFGSNARAATAGLIAALNDPDLVLREAAAESLGRIWANDSSEQSPTNEWSEARELVVAALAKMLESSEGLPRGHQVSEQGAPLQIRVVEALGRIGPPARRTVPLLVELRYGREDVGSATATALKAIGPADAGCLASLLEIAESYTNEWDWRTSWLAMQAIARLGASAKDAVPRLIRLLSKVEHSELQEAAREALKAIGADEEQVMREVRELRDKRAPERGFHLTWDDPLVLDDDSLL